MIKHHKNKNLSSFILNESLHAECSTKTNILYFEIIQPSLYSVNSPHECIMVQAFYEKSLDFFNTCQQPP